MAQFACLSLRRVPGLATMILVSLTASIGRAQPAPPAPPAPPNLARAHLVLLTESKGFVHDVVKRTDNKPSRVESTMKEIGDRTRLFEVEATQDVATLTPEKLRDTQVVVFYTTGKLPYSDEQFKQFDQWIKDGGCFMGIHSATDTFHDYPPYQELIGGEFIAHPWTQDKTVSIKVLDKEHPAGKPWGDGATFKEEIYHFKNFDPAKVHVIIGLDMGKTATPKLPNFIPITWCKEYGKGKVLYTSLGHREDMWTNPTYQEHLIGAIRWLRGLDEGSSKPNPELSAREEELARKAVAATQPATTQSAPKAAADPPTGPKVPDAFTVSTFVKAPEIYSPCSIAVSPRGELFVGEDEYNTQPKRDAGLSRVKMCVDTDGDGKADRITVFAAKINSPQGMTYVGGTLYVVHAPLLTALRDSNGDGVADSRVDLVTGLGPVPEGLVHHVPSGLRMGIDGWLYISIGDKGIVKATGKDGRAISLMGGGVVRVRPDGTMLEVFSYRTRNTFDVSIDPLLNIFTRDNTNDGDGWASRLTQMQRDAEYGYPSLFKNFTDEIVTPIGDYGSGSATGSMYVHEPGLPGTFGESLYTCDWAKGTIFRHELKKSGATFTVTTEEFAKGLTPTDLDLDGGGRFFLADWARRDWGASGHLGNIYLVRAKSAAKIDPFPNMAAASIEQLLEHLVSPSQIRQREAQCELLRRGPGQKLDAALTNIALRSSAPLSGRVAALFTLKQLEGEDAHGTIATLAQHPDLREFALRALADRDDQLHGVNAALFTAGLKDPNPRVRVQSAIGIGHLKKPELAGALVPATGDTDPMVRHAAMQSLRRLNSAELCIAALNSGTSSPEVIAGALRTMRSFHDAGTVAAVSELIIREKSPALRREGVHALARLYLTEAPWDGKWWTPHPDTRGPYYNRATWALSPDVARMMLREIDDPDPETAKLAIFQAGLCEAPETVPALARLAVGSGKLREDSAKALIAMKAKSPEALSAIEKVITSESFTPEIRASAAQALGATEGPAAQAVLVRVLRQLDATRKLPPGLLEKSSDALAARPPVKDQLSAVLSLLSARQSALRVAAATSLLRASEPSVRDRLTRMWQGSDVSAIEALLGAVPRLPPEAAGPYRDPIRALLKDKRDPIRQAAMLALGHLGDASAVKELVALASREPDPLAAVTALAHIDPAHTADDQVTLVAQLLVQTSTKAQKGNDRETYARLLGAAQKFLSDPRVPTTQASKLRSQLMEPGVIYNYLRTDPIPVATADATFAAAFPPEKTPGGPFIPFSVDGREVKWKPLVVNDPKGEQVLDMPPNSVVYLTATYDAPAAESAQLCSGSDDGLQIWLNGKAVVAKDLDRGLKADMDKTPATLRTGQNVLLLKVNNHGDGSGVQARILSRPAEFDPHELARFAYKINPDPAKGRPLFESVGCVKCHTIGRHDEPRGPFLGDAGSKFDGTYITESILRPGAKIAQGFQTEVIAAKGGGNRTDYVGFVTRETAEEVQLRDLSGRVSVVPKSSIIKRGTQPGSMMPENLVDKLTLDEFACLLAYVQSLK